MRNEIFAVYDHSDMLRFVDEETFVRLTEPASKTHEVERYAAALRPLGYMAIEAELAKDMIRSHQLVTMLKAKAQAKSTEQRAAPAT